MISDTRYKYSIQLGLKRIFVGKATNSNLSTLTESKHAKLEVRDIHAAKL